MPTAIDTLRSGRSLWAVAGPVSTAAINARVATEPIVERPRPAAAAPRIASRRDETRGVVVFLGLAQAPGKEHNLAPAERARREENLVDYVAFARPFALKSRRRFRDIQARRRPAARYLATSTDALGRSVLGSRSNPLAIRAWAFAVGCAVRKIQSSATLPRLSKRAPVSKASIP